MEKIKLVIWDLDETFWKGTLSEEGVEIIESNIQIVKELTNRGIMNSIVSKNNFDKAKQTLIEIGIWEYFIFPAIKWSPKGLLIKDIIEKCQLRDINVLFLDDNHLNLEEAKYYNPNINVESPNFIVQILNHKAFKGKNDETKSRLKQYKILEEKDVDKVKFTDNIEFLKSSNIRIEYISDLKMYEVRLHELIERTNQLNYTKVRLDENEIKELIGNSALSSVLIRVIDNYGDYGIVGFYSINNISQKLIHFVFSCRVINLGIPQYIYAKLNFPSLDIIPEVSEKLDLSVPTWIKEINSVSPFNIIQEKSEKGIKIFFKGGCDLSQMLFYLNGYSIYIQEETNYVSNDNFDIHQEHSQILIDSLLLDKNDKQYCVENVPFVDSKFYFTKVFDLDYDILVYSLLMDYTHDVYIHKTRNIKLPYGGYSHSWTDPKHYDEILEIARKKKMSTLTRASLDLFGQEFYNSGQISTKDFLNNLRFIRFNIPNHIPIIFINGAEIKSPTKLEDSALERHIVMNLVLEDFVKESQNCYILDVRKIVNNGNQITNNIRHYTRESYKQLSGELINLLQQIGAQKIRQTKKGYFIRNFMQLWKRTSIYKVLSKISLL